MSAVFAYLRKMNTRSIWRLVGVLACVVLWLGLPALIQAGEKRPKPLKIVGVVTQVEPRRVAILGPRSKEVIVQAQEDFTDKVAVGSNVTAWYFAKDGVDVLQWLEYPLESFFVPPQQFLSQIKKIIILPHSSVDDADGLFDAMASFLETKRGWYIAPRMLAEEIRERARASTSTLEAVDALTGEVDLGRYQEAHRELIRKLASETGVDAVLEANLERVQANFRHQVAAWDGVRQPVAGKASRVVSTMAAIPIHGHVPAASMLLKLWDPQANLLWRNQRGFAVLALQVGVGNKFRERPLSEALQDSASVGSWLTLVFGSVLPKDAASSVAAKQ